MSILRRIDQSSASLAFLTWLGFFIVQIGKSNWYSICNDMNVYKTELYMPFLYFQVFLAVDNISGRLESRLQSNQSDISWIQESSGNIPSNALFYKHHGLKIYFCRAENSVTVRLFHVIDSRIGKRLLPHK